MANSSSKGTLIYEENHMINVRDVNATTSKQCDLSIRIIKKFNSNIVIKLFEYDNYGFNYTASIDYNAFNRMKIEQQLEIGFDELQSQIVDLLNDVRRQQMYLRLDVDEGKCKMIFYEKARLKSLIFLTVDLNVTDQMEIVNEMVKNLSSVKESNKSLSYQLANIKIQLDEKETLLERSQHLNKMIEKQVKKDIEKLEMIFTATLQKLEQTIIERQIKLNRKLIKLLNDIEIIKAENQLKCESNLRLVNSMQHLRIENERNHKIIDDLNVEVRHLNLLKNNIEETSTNNRQLLNVKDGEISNLEKRIDELKKDLQDATLIIAQKSKTHDEIAKDLIQANTMLVNFNNQCDGLSQQLEEAHDVIKRKEKVIKEQGVQLIKISDEFAKYKQDYNVDELGKVRDELRQARGAISELEKQHQEAVKLNGLLTRKLSTGDFTYNGNSGRNQRF